MTQSNVYPEVVGNWCRGNTVPPPVFPDKCPTCGAMTIATSALGVLYDCGGSYLPKPQCQNHTDYWWGQCRKGGR